MTHPAETEKAREKNALFLRRLRESLPEKSLCTEAIAKAVTERLEIRHDGDVVKATIRDDMYDSFIRLPNVQAEMRAITREIWGSGTEFVVTSGSTVARRRARKGAEAKGHVDPLFDAQSHGSAPSSSQSGASGAGMSHSSSLESASEGFSASNSLPPPLSRSGATSGRRASLDAPFDDAFDSAVAHSSSAASRATNSPANPAAGERARRSGASAGTPVACRAAGASGADSESSDPLGANAAANARRNPRAGAGARPSSLVEQALSAVTDKETSRGRKSVPGVPFPSTAPNGSTHVPVPRGGTDREIDGASGASVAPVSGAAPHAPVQGHAPVPHAEPANPLPKIEDAEAGPKPKMSRLAVLGDINKMSTPSPFVVPLSMADDAEHRPGESPERALDPSLTFDTFVQGTNNEIASLACMNAARNPGKLSNPVFIYGSTGLGKTHLLHAVGNEIRRNHPDWRVLYVTSEDFIVDFMRALRHHKSDEMRRKYRNVDVLLVDDIQFFENKDSTQIEFFHTFNQLYNDKKQIVLTSDQYPKSIPNIEERLKSRFLQGLIASIEPPTFEDRAAIIEVKAKSFGLRLGRDQVDFIAQHVKTNVREITGVLNTLLMNQSIKGEPPSLEAIQQLLRKESRSHSSGVDVFSIQKAVSGHFGIKLPELMGASRKENFVLPRHVAMYLAREMLSMTTTEIAIAFGRKDHTTVLNAVKRITEMLEQDASTLATVKELRRKLEHGSH